MIVLSHYQAEDLWMARQAGEEQITSSLDLGLTTVEVALDEDGICLPGGLRLSWETVAEIRDAENSCFVVELEGLMKVQFYSELTNRLYSLMPTEKAPTMLVSGIPMHRIKGTDPQQDTREKIRATKPVVGMVLDTATGLGYTAIQASESAELVVTIELDPVALEVAHYNPWSQRLFNNPKINQLIGDSCELVEDFEGDTFNRIIHDPPAFNLAGDLYSGEFYRQLYRLLRPGGRLFHYIGDPNSKSGRNITAGVVERLRKARFKAVKRAPRAFGVVGYK
jgi:predicted methyltransferase